MEAVRNSLEFPFEVICIILFLVAYIAYTMELC